MATLPDNNPSSDPWATSLRIGSPASTQRSYPAFNDTWLERNRASVAAWLAVAAALTLLALYALPWWRELGFGSNPRTFLDARSEYLEDGVYGTCTTSPGTATSSSVFSCTRPGSSSHHASPPAGIGGTG